MAKKKTCKTARKRLKLTATGKIKRFRPGKSHLLSKKSAKRRRKLRTATLVHSSEERKVKELMLA
ncbi:MAG: 50S ribosomal protein L35 [Planctomycetota bacterium]|nr:MAG: 50S ribosomal protein L35 [Planctomycetota bacterium]